MDKINKWLETRNAKIIVGIAALLVSYDNFSTAIDTGSIAKYVIAIIILLFGLMKLSQAVQDK